MREDMVQVDSVPAASNEKVTEPDEQEAPFTPGPWEYNAPGMYRQVSGRFSDVAVYAPGNAFPWRMAEVVGPDDLTAIANACLIAAAPDLYEALLVAAQYVRQFAECAPMHDGGEEAIDDLAKVGAALAKARGAQVTFSDDAASRAGD